MLGVERGTVRGEGWEMDHIRFGAGGRVLVILPGLGDSLRTVRETALPLAAACRAYGRERKVYLFSRRRGLEPGATIRGMAEDQAEAMKKLGLWGADVLGISQGGMVAQYLAAEAPELVRRLVLVVTAGWANETVQETVGRWLLLAERGDYRRLMRDTAERSYSQRYLRRYRLLLPLLGTIGRPRSYQRFLIQARACLGHDARGALGRIGCPALVVGGGRDQVVGAEAAGVLAEHLSQSRLWIYPELGHGLYEEAADLPARVLAFLSQ